MNPSLKLMLIRHEGMRLKPYRDTVGKLTIGIGRNLDDVGISQEEALLMLDQDIARTQKEMFLKIPMTERLDSVRYDVLLSMCFNMGTDKVAAFKKMLDAIIQYDYEEASSQMLNSKWAIQVGDRAKELAQMMRTGSYRKV